MQEWEYAVDHESGAMSENKLDDMGKEGWELVAVTVDQLNRFVYHFKRALENNP